MTTNAVPEAIKNESGISGSPTRRGRQLRRMKMRVDGFDRTVCSVPEFLNRLDGTTIHLPYLTTTTQRHHRFRIAKSREAIAFDRGICTRNSPTTLRKYLVKKRSANP